MGTTDVRGDQIFHDPVTFAGAVYLPQNAVTGGMISADAANRIPASKVVHRPDCNYSQANGADVASATVVVRVCRGTGQVNQVAVRPTTVPAGGNKQYTVDVQKAADGSGSWTSLLSAPVTVDTTAVANTRKTGTLVASPTVADGDALRVVVTASGSTGTQGQGLVVTIGMEEQSAT